MTDDELKAMRERWEDIMEPDHGCTIEAVPQPPTCGVCKRKRAASFSDLPRLLDEVERLRAENEALRRVRDAAAAHIADWDAYDGAVETGREQGDLFAERKSSAHDVARAGRETGDCWTAAYDARIAALRAAEGGG